jgi:hypothetical protein
VVVSVSKKVRKDLNPRGLREKCKWPKIKVAHPHNLTITSTLYFVGMLIVIS